MARASVQTPTSVITIERFILEQEQLHPEATGELSNLLYDICLAAKIISRNVRRAGLSGILGAAGSMNVQGEAQQNLDVFANETVRNSVQHTGRICVMASEEDPQPVPVPAHVTGGSYVLLYDPLDGSSNIDVNVSIGTIFSIHRRVTPRPGPGKLEDCLQRGRKQVAAGYILYGSSTMFVFTTGQGVHGFTLDTTIGEFLLSHPDIRTPEIGTYYSVNESHWNHWSPAVQRVVGAFKNGDGDTIKPRNARYIGSLVADFHRNLMSGGIFLYPADSRNPHGKLRLLYEGAPLSMLVEQAGGAATDGTTAVLDLVPTDLHQRVPLVIGSRADVAYATDIISRGARG
jgi:fructose-1,6-bisphosphatase I